MAKRKVSKKATHDSVGMGLSDAHLNELTEALLGKRLAFLVGAGISMGRQSQLPGWESLVFALMEGIAGPQWAQDEKYVRDHAGLLLNEVLLQHMKETLGLEDTANALVRALGTEKYSRVHRFLAWAIAQCEAQVLTSNMDKLIEEAARPMPRNSLPERLFQKLHGTISDPTTLRFTVEAICCPLAARVTEQVKPELQKRVLIVAGYRGADEFDILPLIFSDAVPEALIWLVHPGAGSIEGKLDPLVRERMKGISTRPGDRLSGYFFQDADQLFEELYRRAASRAPKKKDSELESPWSTAPVGNRDGWWKAGIQEWARQVWERDELHVHLLWARILDYLRAYKLGSRRPTAKAYDRYLELARKKKDGIDGEIAVLSAESRLAYIKRTTGDLDVHEFTTLIGRFEKLMRQADSIASASDEHSAGELRGLYAWVLHQFGTALQGSGDHFGANLVLQEAARLRTIFQNDQAAYSLFQMFMNSWQGASQKRCFVDDFAPPGWRHWLADYLHQVAERFHKSHALLPYAETLHNVAFVYQALALEQETAGALEHARSLFQLAARYYSDAKTIRERLRDPRLRAQSDVRLAQCHLGQARIACRKREGTEAIEILILQAETLGKDVQTLYESMPQETFRTKDVDDILAECQHLRKECLKK